jgi:hypothetical protein
MSDDARFDPRFDPAFQPGYDGPLAEAKPVTRAKPVASVPEALPAVRDPAPEREPEPEDEPVSRRTNPFLITLGVVAILLLGGGLYVVSRLRDLFADTQSTSDFDYVTLQVLMYAAPLVLVLGLATGIGVLFLLAARWGRR